MKFGRWRALNMVQLLLFTWNLPPRVRDGVALTRGQAGCAHTTRRQVREPLVGSYAACGGTRFRAPPPRKQRRSTLLGPPQLAIQTA